MIIPSSLVLLPGVFAVACAGFPIPTQTMGAVFTAAGLAASETVAPLPELVRARRAYDRARQGPAAQLDPADLVTAKERTAELAESRALEVSRRPTCAR
jgi:hypothetical protein